MLEGGCRLKYLSRAPFSSKAATEDYRDKFDATFGAKAKACAWCGGTGYTNEAVEFGSLIGERCPKGCEAPK